MLVGMRYERRACLLAQWSGEFVASLTILMLSQDRLHVSRISNNNIMEPTSDSQIQRRHERHLASRSFASEGIDPS